MFYLHIYFISKKNFNKIKAFEFLSDFASFFIFKMIIVSLYHNT